MISRVDAGARFQPTDTSIEPWSAFIVFVDLDNKLAYPLPPPTTEPEPQAAASAQSTPAQNPPQPPTQPPGLPPSTDNTAAVMAPPPNTPPHHNPPLRSPTRPASASVSPRQLQGPAVDPRSPAQHSTDAAMHADTAAGDVSVPPATPSGDEDGCSPMATAGGGAAVPWCAHARAPSGPATSAPSHPDPSTSFIPEPYHRRQIYASGNALHLGRGGECSAPRLVSPFSAWLSGELSSPSLASQVCADRRPLPASGGGGSGNGSAHGAYASGLWAPAVAEAPQCAAELHAARAWFDALPFRAAPVVAVLPDGMLGLCTRTSSAASAGGLPEGAAVAPVGAAVDAATPANAAHAAHAASSACTGAGGSGVRGPPGAAPRLAPPPGTDCHPTDIAAVGPGAALHVECVDVPMAEGDGGPLPWPQPNPDDPAVPRPEPIDALSAECRTGPPPGRHSMCGVALDADQPECYGRDSGGVCAACCIREDQREPEGVKLPGEPCGGADADEGMGRAVVWGEALELAGARGSCLISGSQGADSPMYLWGPSAGPPAPAPGVAERHPCPQTQGGLPEAQVAGAMPDADHVVHMNGALSLMPLSPEHVSPQRHSSRGADALRAGGAAAGAAADSAWPVRAGGQPGAGAGAAGGTGTAGLPDGDEEGVVPYYFFRKTLCVADFAGTLPARPLHAPAPAPGGV